MIVPMTGQQTSWWKKWWIWAIVGGVLAIGVIGNALKGSDEPTASPDTTEQAETPAEEPVDTEEPEDAESLADRVRDSLLTGLNVDEFWQAGTEGRTSPLATIADIEDVSSTTVRVHIQDALTDEQREEVARHVFQLTSYDIDDLNTVVVQDTSGIDSNHYS